MNWRENHYCSMCWIPPERWIPAKICVVYGHGGDAVPRAVAQPDVQMVLQEPQLGTGHALQQAMPYLDADHVTLVLYGDVPLIRAETLLSLLQIALPGKVALLTMVMDEPRGYGRIVRKSGKVVSIVEEKDATPEERAIHEVNTGIMVVPNLHLAAWLAALKNDNAQGEYYLTDVIALAVSSRALKLPPCIRRTTGKFSASTARASLRTWSACISTNRRRI